MRIYDIIRKKRDKEILTTEEINFFVDQLVKEEVADYQVSALLMAMFLNDLSESEMVDLTRAMMLSGDLIDLSKVDGVKVDKHSTGGVGDKTTLVLAPLVASCDVAVCKMSGRGLGHTGGTLDKLESIKGFDIKMSSEDFIATVNKSKIAVIGQTKNIAPADKKLYALRDVTATVENIGLIASSIMSKKLACGSDAIVLDVKSGSGAFMKDLASSQKLAEAMIKIGKAMDKKMSAFITDMSQPLGRAVGNSLEVIEAIETLKGNGPSDFKELCIELACKMVEFAREDLTESEVRNLVCQNLENGLALKKLAEMIENQGGDSRVIDDYSLFGKASFVVEVKSEVAGYITEFDCENIGIASMVLGAGRQTKEDAIDYTAGIVLNKKIGDKVIVGESICTLYTNKESLIKDASSIVLNSISITSENTSKPSIILKRL